MSDERPDSLTIHVPPAFNRYGNRQVWWVETGRQRLDNLLNGALSALLVSLLIVGGSLLEVVL